MESDENFVRSNDALIEVLEDIDDKSVAKMLSFVQGKTSASELSFADWIEPLKEDTRVWIVIFDNETAHTSWLHYREDIDELCVHPVNDWDPHEVDVDALKSMIREEESSIELEPEHQENTPFAKLDS